jgi:hypothetical protein
MEKRDKYWQRWEKLIEVASNLQGLFPDAALAEKAGMDQTVAALGILNFYYYDLTRKDEVSPLIQLIRQLAEPNPYDLDDIDVSQYKGIGEPLNSWDYIKNICEKILVELGDKLSEQ